MARRGKFGVFRKIITFNSKKWTFYEWNLDFLYFSCIFFEINHKLVSLQKK